MHPAAAGSREQLVPDRIVGNANYRNAPLSQRDRHHEFGNPLDELLGAVERVDDPHPLVAQSHAVVGGLLGKPSVIGKTAMKNLLESVVGLEVGAW